MVLSPQDLMARASLEKLVALQRPAKKETVSQNRDNKDIIVRSLGISFDRPEVVAGIFGNIRQEAGAPLDFRQKELGGGPGEGLFQFSTDGFKNAYKQFLDELGFEDSVDSQVGFISNILDTDEFYDIGAGHRSALKEVFETGDVGTITKEFSERVLRPGTPMLDQRIKFAEEMFKELQLKQ